MPDTPGVRPRLKSTSPIFQLEENIYINGYGEVNEIPDPGGKIKYLLDLLDGTRLLSQVYEDFMKRYPEVPSAHITAAIEQFDELKYLENAAYSASDILEEHDVERWHRNINFFGSYAHLDESKFTMQRRLKDAHVALLGIGGLGSHLLLDMAAMGIGHVTAVEFDRVELSNLNRQILYRESDIGQLKLRLAVERVKDFNPTMVIDPLPMKMDSIEDVRHAIGGADLVICVADRPKMEIGRWVNEACVLEGVPFVTGGLETQRAVHYTIIPGKTGCVECWGLQVTTGDPVSAALLTEKRRINFGGDKAAFCPLVTMTTGLILGEVTRLLTAIAPPVAAGRLMELRFADYRYQAVEQWAISPDCDLCGHQRASDDAPDTDATVASTRHSTPRVSSGTRHDL